MANDNQTPIATVTTSRQWLLNLKDALHGLFVGIAGAIASPLLTYLETNNFHFDVKDMWHLALMSAVSYLLHKWVQPSQTIIAVTPPLKTGSNDDGVSDGSGVENPKKPGTP